MIYNHSGKIHICAGKVFIYNFRENLNSHRFLQILLNEIIPSANQLYPHGMDGFLEDNSPSHQGEAKTYIHENLAYLPMSTRAQMLII